MEKLTSAIKSFDCLPKSSEESSPLSPTSTDAPCRRSSSVAPEVPVNGLADDPMIHRIIDTRGVLDFSHTNATNQGFRAERGS